MSVQSSKCREEQGGKNPGGIGGAVWVKRLAVKAGGLSSILGTETKA